MLSCYQHLPLLTPGYHSNLTSKSNTYATGGHLGNGSYHMTLNNWFDGFFKKLANKYLPHVPGQVRSISAPFLVYWLQCPLSAEQVPLSERAKSSSHGLLLSEDFFSTGFHCPCRHLILRSFSKTTFFLPLHSSAKT